MIAKLLSRSLVWTRALVGMPSTVIAKRQGISWCLDLQQGIDLALYLGVYERSTIDCCKQLLPSDGIFLDIGANIGAFTLEMAAHLNDLGRVVAFEPTVFAFKAQCQNIDINPEIQKKVASLQVMLTSHDQEPISRVDQIYSAWPLAAAKNLHAVHGGQLQSIEGARKATLDEIVEELELTRIDLIKMDVDGYECQVLRGGMQTLNIYKPQVVMELAPYTLREQGDTLVDLINIIRSAGYGLWSLNGAKELPMDADQLDAMCSRDASINVLLRPMDA